MKKALFVLLALLVVGAVPLFGFSITVPNEIPSYVSLEPVLEVAEGDEEIEEARFYVMIEGKKFPPMQDSQKQRCMERICALYGIFR